jgi:hypothetical protein
MVYSHREDLSHKELGFPIHKIFNNNSDSMRDNNKPINKATNIVTFFNNSQKYYSYPLSQYPGCVKNFLLKASKA